MARKTKMNKARKALFAPYPWCDEATQQNLHTQLQDDVIYNKMVEIYKDKLPFTDDREHNGNLIIQNYLEKNPPEVQQARFERLAKRKEAYTKYFHRFREVFNEHLNSYWQDHRFGFDVIKFDIFIEPNEGESTRDAIQRKYGDEALRIVLELMGTDTASENVNNNPSGE